LDSEGVLYRLIKGSTSLMIAAASDDLDNESDESDVEEDDGKSESSRIDIIIYSYWTCGADTLPDILFGIAAMGLLGY
jgi:hypothetical protein